MRVDHLRFWRLTLIIFLLNLLAAQLLHETGHWAVLQAYGRRPLWGFTSMVQIWDRAPTSPSDWVETTSIDGDQGWLYLDSPPASDLEWVLFVAAGPLVQLAAVVVGLMLARYGRSSVSRTLGLLLAAVNAFGGFFYQLVSLLRGVGGDEFLLGHYLGLSPVLISAVLGAAFGLGLFIALSVLDTARRRLKWAAALFLGTLPIGPLLMFANRTVIEQVDAGNPLFRSVLGFSLPVFLTGLLCLLLLGLVSYRWEAAPSGP